MSGVLRRAVRISQRGVIIMLTFRLAYFDGQSDKKLPQPEIFGEHR